MDIVSRFPIPIVVGKLLLVGCNPAIRPLRAFSDTNQTDDGLYCSLFHAHVDANMDQLVLLPAGTRIFLRGDGGLHRGRFQPHGAERDGTFLEGGDGDGPGR